MLLSYDYKKLIEETENFKPIIFSNLEYTITDEEMTSAVMNNDELFIDYVGEKFDVSYDTMLQVVTNVKE